MWSSHNAAKATSQETPGGWVWKNKQTAIDDAHHKSPKMRTATARHPHMATDSTRTTKLGYDVIGTLIIMFNLFLCFVFFVFCFF